jgi:VCBS repeat-containing protein
MADPLSPGITTTSMFNTPQAVDDAYAISEGQGLVFSFNVMSNDLGGNAKTLWSFVDGSDIGLTVTEIADLISKDAANVYEQTSSGASVAIVDGKLRYDATAIASTINALSAGETMTDVVTYAIRLGNGTLSLATMTVTITGTNDVPVAEAGSLSLLEDTTASGHVSATDADDGETAGLIYALVGDAPPGLTFHSDGSYSFDASSYDYLPAGETEVITVHFTASDATSTSAAQTLTITITGSNDVPVAVADMNSGNEDTLITGSVAANDSDADESATLTYELDAPVAGLTLSPDGSYSFDASDAAYQHLAEGATATIVANYTVTDEHGATSTSTLTITLTGTNDVPLAVADTNSGNEDTTISGTVASNDSDADDGAVLSFSTADTIAGFNLNANGSYTLDTANAAYQHLADGVSTDVVVHYTVTDEHGASSDASLTITITGTNDVPVAIAAINAVDEDATVSGNVSATDADAGETAGLSYALVGDAPAGLTFNPNGSYSFDASSYDYLPAGETMILTIGYTAMDAHGASDTSTLTITITGTNDAAVITGSTSGSVTEDAPSNTVSGNLDSTDVDGVDDLWTTASGAGANGYGSFIIDAAGNWIYTLDNSNPAVNDLNDGDTLTDYFTVATADGTMMQVDITINGHTDITAIILLATGTGTDPNDFDNLAPPPSASTSATGGDDIVKGTSGNDNSVNLLGGNDIYYGLAGDDTINGQGGSDTIYGQAGNDTMSGDNDVDSLYGGSGNDTLIGNNGNDKLYGGSGNDTLNGNNDNDLLIGGYGADNLTGGNDSDTFQFLSVLDRGDAISDFSHGEGDKFNVNAIDADGVAGGNQDFTFNGTAVTAHGIWYATSGGVTTVYGDTDGNTSTAELWFTLTNGATLVAGDFIL